MKKTIILLRIITAILRNKQYIIIGDDYGYYLVEKGKVELIYPECESTLCLEDIRG